MRAGAWRDTWRRPRRRIAQRPYICTVLLAFLAVSESLAEFVAGHGSVPRLFAAASSGTGRVQLALLLGVLCLATALPPLFLRPLTASVTVTAANLGSLTLLHTLTAAGLAAQLVAQYRQARTGATLLALLLGAPFLAWALATVAGTSTSTGTGTATDLAVRTVLLAALAPAAACAGLAARAAEHRRAHSAARRVMAVTEWENAARGERARIVRELHDVVGHHLSMIAVQAETARVATPGMPAQGAERLLGIGDTARAALTEMRRLLGVLRTDTGSATGAELGPQPDLRHLDELLDEARSASGGSVRLVLSGFPRALDPGVELAAYRIVQESLTNARRHARGAAVDVELHYAADRLHLRVRDNGPGPATGRPADGHGLLGMRERAAAVAGDVRTGPADVGGFLVAARFPAPPRADPEARTEDSA
ncbi:sensor histidine kinase [Streptomyces sp. NPDC094038]|uniref:sensor histidine kinase n=1 Tax=Streptomyces sp. NPDC094038 TaxID=3366055 RepID=UPI00381EDEC8